MKFILGFYLYGDLKDDTGIYDMIQNLAVKINNKNIFLK